MSSSPQTPQKIVDPELRTVTLEDPSQVLGQWTKGLTNYLQFVYGKEARPPQLSIGRVYARGGRNGSGVVISNLPSVETLAVIDWCQHREINIIDNLDLIRSHAYLGVKDGGQLVFTKGLLYPEVRHYSERMEYPYGENEAGHNKFCLDLSAVPSSTALIFLLCGISTFSPFALPTPENFIIRSHERGTLLGTHLALWIIRSSPRKLAPNEVRVIEIPDCPMQDDLKVTKRCTVIPTRASFQRVS